MAGSLLSLSVTSFQLKFVTGKKCNRQVLRLRVNNLSGMIEHGAKHARNDLTFIRCKWRFGWFKNADNPSMSFVRVKCPTELTSRSGCTRKDDGTQKTG
jgi:hypothetical protein